MSNNLTPLARNGTSRYFSHQSWPIRLNNPVAGILLRRRFMFMIDVHPSVRHVDKKVITSFQFPKT
jgi:hypothetical protein